MNTTCDFLNMIRNVQNMCDNIQLTRREIKQSVEIAWQFVYSEFLKHKMITFLYNFINENTLHNSTTQDEYREFNDCLPILNPVSLKELNDSIKSDIKIIEYKANNNKYPYIEYYLALLIKCACIAVVGYDSKMPCLFDQLMINSSKQCQSN
jgi:hypothetical protein